MRLLLRGDRLPCGISRAMGAATPAEYWSHQWDARGTTLSAECAPGHTAAHIDTGRSYAGHGPVHRCGHVFASSRCGCRLAVDGDSSHDVDLLAAATDATAGPDYRLQVPGKEFRCALRHPAGRLLPAPAQADPAAADPADQSAAQAQAIVAVQAPTPTRVAAPEPANKAKINSAVTPRVHKGRDRSSRQKRAARPAPTRPIAAAY